MSLPQIIFGVGATKAGTSWLWEVLSAHPQVTARSVKELHYFDTDAAEDRARVLKAFAASQARMAEPHRVTDMQALREVLAADRARDAGYAGYVARGGVALDVTPSYGVLPVAVLRRMVDVFAARFVYLVRDPVERLWSHIRMEVTRRMQPGADFDNRARGMLRRITEDAGEPQIVVRGDYAGALGRLGEAVPEGQLRVLVSEEMTVADVYDAAGLEPYDAPVARAHEGTDAKMRDGMRNRAARFLKDQYQFMANYLGRVPPAWRANYERAFA